METRKQREKEFHDQLRQVNEDIHVADTRWSPELEETIKNNPMWVNMKYYSIERQSRAMILDWFKDNCQGKQVLDYCCGNGEDGVFIAQNGAKEVVGIDISDVSITNCKALARKNGVERLTSYQVADAENTGFDDNSFDVVTEYGALHHLDLESAFSEMSRILKPDGKIICNEALGHNLLINAYRKLTPNLRTEWEVEHILRKESFDIAGKYFDKIDIHFYYLFTLLAVPFRKFFIFESVLSILERIDNFILRLPLIKWQAWQIVFVLSEPKKN